MKMLEWQKSQYGSDISIFLGSVGSISVTWSMSKEDHKANTPYIVDVFGKTLKKKFKDQEKAKDYAIKHAKYFLEQARSKLDTDSEEE